jgi:hypothetical protein
MASHLDFEGVYDKSKRFMFLNWSSEDFTQHFGAESVYNDTRLIESQPAFDITVKAGDMRELGHFQAHICTKHFVNREMLRDASGLVDKARERAEMGVNNAELRKPYEDKTLAEIKVGQEAPFMDKLREEIRKEEKAKLVSQETVTQEAKPKKEVKAKKGEQKVEEFEG